MIRRFRHKGLKRLYERGDRSAVGADRVDKVERILGLLDVAKEPQGLNLPGLRLHPLKGALSGMHAVWVTPNWRIIFRFEGGDAWDVELIDYH